MAKKIELKVALSREKVLATIAEAIASLDLKAESTVRPVVGRVHGDSFSLRVKTRYRFPFDPVLKGTVVDAGVLSVIRGSVAIPASRAAIMMVFFGLVGGVILRGIARAATSGRSLADLLSTFVPLAVFVVAMLVVWSASAKPQKLQLVAFLPELFRDEVTSHV